MNIKTLVECAKYMPPSQSILLRGPTGVGKSQIAQQIANYHSLPLIDVRGPTMSEGDTGGYPDIESMKENGVMTFVMPSWFMRACREPVVLLLDELNRSLRGVQQSFFQLVLDRQLGNDKHGNPYKLNPETRIIAAVNSGSEYDVNDMDPALLRRFWVVDVDCRVDSWLSWAEDNNIDEMITEFIRTHHEHLFVDPSKVEPETVIPTPASWDKFNTMLNYANIDLSKFAGTNRKSTKVYNLATGFVGTETSIAFCDFLKKFNNVILCEHIIDEWDNYKEKVSKLNSDKINSIISKIVNHFKDNKWTVDQAENASKFAKTIPHEMVIHFWSEMTKTKNIDNIQKVHRFLGSYIVDVVNTSKNILK